MAFLLLVDLILGIVLNKYNKQYFRVNIKNVCIKIIKCFLYMILQLVVNYFRQHFTLLAQYFWMKSTLCVQYAVQTLNTKPHEDLKQSYLFKWMA